MNKVFITGMLDMGCALTDYLIEKGYIVTVYDLFIYGEDVFKKKNNLIKIKGDIRDENLLKKSLEGQDIVIHLACISNDPSFELNPSLGQSINLDAFEPLVRIAKNQKVKRFIYASSSSVYGIKEIKNVSEDVKLEPITDYSKFKAEWKTLNNYIDDEFLEINIRPATVWLFEAYRCNCEYFNEFRFHKKEITIFGGDQLRPNIHIKDMLRAYHALMIAPSDVVNGDA